MHYLTAYIPLFLNFNLSCRIYATVFLFLNGLRPGFKLENA